MLEAQSPIKRGLQSSVNIDQSVSCNVVASNNVVAH